MGLLYLSKLINMDFRECIASAKTTDRHGKRKWFVFGYEQDREKPV